MSLILKISVCKNQPYLIGIVTMAYIHLLGFLLLAAHTTAGAVLYDKTSQSEDVTNMVNEKALDFLDNMMSCTTNRTFLETLVDFGFYGCYCGFGGFGKPVDGVDRCCQVHDECYGATHLIEGGACYLNIAAYIAPYKFTLHQCDTEDAYITCAGIDKYYWYDFLPECAVAICKCDRALAMCIAHEPFHKQNRFYNRLKCLGEDVDEQARP